MLLSLDGTFLIQILNFIVFWALLNYLFVAPTRRAIEARQRFLAAQHAEADELSSVASSLAEEMQRVLNEARRQTAAIMREAAADAERKVREIEHEALEEANALAQRARVAVAGEQAQAISKQGPFVEELARTMVERATALDKVA
jgi:F-type H+-transporting ATPase subunit b